MDTDSLWLEVDEVGNEVNGDEVKTNSDDGKTNSDDGSSTTGMQNAQKPKFELATESDVVNHDLTMICQEMVEDQMDTVIECEEDVLSVVQCLTVAQKKVDYENYKTKLNDAKNQNIKVTHEEDLPNLKWLLTSTNNLLPKMNIASPINPSRPLNEISIDPVNQTNLNRTSQRMPAPNIATLIPNSNTNNVEILLTQPNGKAFILPKSSNFRFQQVSPANQAFTLTLPDGAIPQSLIVQKPATQTNSTLSIRPTIANNPFRGQVYFVNPNNPQTMPRAQYVCISNTSKALAPPRFQATLPVAISRQKLMPLRGRPPTINTPTTSTIFNSSTKTIKHTYSKSSLLASSEPRNKNVQVYKITQDLKLPVRASSSSDLLESFSIIKGGTKSLTVPVLMSIKPLPFSWPSDVKILIQSLVKLDKYLMQQKFKECPILWMINNKFISKPKCKICSREFIKLKIENDQFGNESWQCNPPCFVIQEFSRPSLLTEFKLPSSKLLFSIYYWSIQVDVEDLIKSKQIEIDTIIMYQIWKKLQSVCGAVLAKTEKLLGIVGQKSVIEVATVNVGGAYVIGAQDIVSGAIKMKAIDTATVQQCRLLGTNIFIEIIKKWIHPYSSIKTCEVKFTSLRKFGYQVILVSRAELITGTTRNRIGIYLIQHLKRFFSDVMVINLTAEMINLNINELLWREKYGTEPYSAFINITKHITETNPEELIKKDLIIVKEPIKVSAPPEKSVKSNLAETKKTKEITPNDPGAVYVDEFFYSSFEIKKRFAKNVSPSEFHSVSWQCHICKMYFNNILIVKHLLEHLEKDGSVRGNKSKKRGNKTECLHCLRFFNGFSIHQHIQLANLTMVKFGCRICNLPIHNKMEYIKHMKNSHCFSEMPYSCCSCLYRSSFLKEVLNHFEHNHVGSDILLCPFCLKSFDSKQENKCVESIYDHLTTHYAIASVYECNCCNLTFLSKNDLDEHQQNDHGSKNIVDESFELVPFKLTYEQRSLSVLAYDYDFKKIADTNDKVHIEDPVPCLPSTSTSSAKNIQLTLFAHPLMKSIYSNEQIESMLLSHNFLRGLLSWNYKYITCKECNTTIANDHFISQAYCALCKYSTFCKNSFTEHMILMHSKRSIDRSIASYLGVRSTSTKKYIKCTCGFKTVNGNNMAGHLSRSGHSFCIVKS